MDDRVKDGRRSATVVLAEWRAAERQLGDLREGSSEWHRTRLRVDALSAEYQDLIDEQERIPGESTSGAQG